MAQKSLTFSNEESSGGLEPFGSHYTDPLFVRKRISSARAITRPGRVSQIIFYPLVLPRYPQRCLPNLAGVGLRPPASAATHAACVRHMSNASATLDTGTICLRARATAFQRDGGITAGCVFASPPRRCLPLVWMCVCATGISQQNWITPAERTLIFPSPYHG